ncbi:hypothetical protein [Mycolicibacterium sphagni]|jgi:hypothetical protein|uniref:Uncharacterized protein n=1 Tax=Mycolicibacterium sphagni TaxID=1786 RepID=A0A255DZG8_9MYCO|nr:hypothetical protein [Mycolicibacterium sphagni]MCV7175619.1 hypothetical protein [Mycolicibacterium sphagni]OYN81183.1 hypothetical protein CG716_06515 [Mycolicibacterium sphagni]
MIGMERSRRSAVSLPSAAINPHRGLMGFLMVVIFIAGVVGVVVALSMGHAAFVLSIVLIAFGLIAAAAIC